VWRGGKKVHLVGTFGTAEEAALCVAYAGGAGGGEKGCGRCVCAVWEADPGPWRQGFCPARK
jgi:hypothetical protein